MRNLLAALGLSVDDSADHWRSVLDTLPPEDADYRTDLETIVDNPQWLTHYKRVQQQYESMAATRSQLLQHGFLDSHHWEQRLVEFEHEVTGDNNFSDADATGDPA